MITYNIFFFIAKILEHYFHLLSICPFNMSLLSIVESPLIYIIVGLFSNIDKKEKLNIAMIKVI